MKKLLLFIAIGMFLIGTVSALEIDNWKFDKVFEKDKPITIGEKDIEYKPIWEKYKPQRIDNWIG